MSKPPVRRGRSSPILNKPAYRDAPAPDREFEAKPNFDLLDDAEKEAIRAKAAAKVEARERDRAMQAFLDEEIARIERELHPESVEEEKEIDIDLALYADRIIINGKHYMHGRRYKVKKSLYDSMNEIMWRTKKHHEETHRDPMKVMQEAQQAIAKGGRSYATLSANTGQRF